MLELPGSSALSTIAGLVDDDEKLPPASFKNTEHTKFKT